MNNGKQWESRVFAGRAIPAIHLQWKYCSVGSDDNDAGKIDEGFDGERWRAMERVKVNRKGKGGAQIR